MRWGRKHAVVAGALTLAVGAFAGATLHAAPASASLPSASASPQQVLRVYLKAAKAHDCATTEALTVDSPDQRSMAWCGGGTFSLFSNHPDLLSYGHIGKDSEVSPDEAGGDGEDCIPVDITETNMSGAEPGSMPGWQFCFVKTAAGWRLGDEGYG
ncbi:hypothetical protein [Frondihabitans australicus]|uniref:Uncharacterized protein n=1 Tax=Frondihabitans australicus TaxID=386892 RepID=A0A495IIS3_9MICO|nr:hypothetical protein [Frondihabitans australicus]RKR75600.1 hypothetical protein C8E83_2748 [Frondihabitans australicus]